MYIFILKKSLIFFLQTHIKYIILYNYLNIDLNIKSEYFPYIATVFILPGARRISGLPIFFGISFL